MMGNSRSELQKGDTVSALIDGVLLLANANQEQNYRRRALMRPQLNANYKHLCNPSNPVIAELFGDDFPKAINYVLEYDEITEEVFWTESKVVIGYIRNDACRFHVFVANRVQRIRDVTLPDQWRYVESDLNPADEASWAYMHRT